jgi:gliding motility-associated lipoprotein GldD
MNKSFLILLCVILFVACNEEAIIPKPRGYERIDLPPKKYYRSENPCNYSMDVPEYATVELDKYPNAEPCWFNVEYKPFHATLHLSYKHIANRDSLFKLLNDSRTMVYKHTMKADEIFENYISRPGKYGIFYELDGNTATNAQFYITDSTKHFLRGSLYFNAATNQDSIAPVLAYLKKDMLRLIETLEWK